jgi:hypothetical protein
MHRPSPASQRAEILTTLAVSGHRA